MSVFVDWLFGKAMDFALEARRFEALDEDVRSAVAAWRESLPLDFQEQDYWHDLFSVHHERYENSSRNRPATDVLT